MDYRFEGLIDKSGKIKPIVEDVNVNKKIRLNLNGSDWFSSELLSRFDKDIGAELLYIIDDELTNKNTTTNILLNGYKLISDLWFTGIAPIENEVIDYAKKHNIDEYIVCMVKLTPESTEFENYITNKGRFVFDIDKVDEMPTTTVSTYKDGMILVKRSIPGDTEKYKLMRCDGSFVFDEWTPYYLKWFDSSKFGIREYVPNYFKFFDHNGNIIGGKLGEEGFYRVNSVGHDGLCIVSKEFENKNDDLEYKYKIFNTKNKKYYPDNENEWLMDAERYTDFFSVHFDGDDKEKYLSTKFNLFDTAEEAIEDSELNIINNKQDYE